jgi:hypothetical protein
MADIDVRLALRDTGRTKAMVLGLPHTGATVIVHTAVLRDYVRHMIRDLRGATVEAATRVCVIRDSHDITRAMAGRRGSFHVDHAFWDYALSPLRAEVAAHLDIIERKSA